MRATLMTISAGGDSFAPGAQHDAIRGPHRFSHGGIEVSFYLFPQTRQLVTYVTVRRRGSNSGVGVVTSEASRMTVGNCLESALLQPECIAQILWRLGHILFAGFTLRLISLMTNGAVGRGRFLLLAAERNSNERRFCGSSWRLATDYLKMSFMREIYGELAAEVSLRLCRVRDVAQTRKQKTRTVARSYGNMAVGADFRCRSLAREELLAVAIQTCAMLRKFGDVWKSCLPFTNFLPIRSRELVAGITGKLFFCDVSGVRKV